MSFHVQIGQIFVLGADSVSFRQEQNNLVFVLVTVMWVSIHITSSSQSSCNS